MVSAETTKVVETGVAALLFAVIFLAGRRLHPLRALIRDRRSIISFGAGMSAAYVFVHVMPELQGVRRAFAESTSATLPWEGMTIYLLALLGFLAFYGLDHLREQLLDSAAEGEGRQAFRVHVGGFAAYVGLTSYLLVRSLEETVTSTALYVVAIAFHLLSVDHSLREEHGAAYDRTGRFLLAGMAVLGWGTGLLVDLPRPLVALLLAFLSGAVIMNSAIMELPSEKDGRFLPFLAGGLLYGLALLPLG
jgi:hypothetical protein